VKYRERLDHEYFDPIRGELAVSRPLSWVEWCAAHAFVTNGAHKGRWSPDTFPLLTEAMALVDRSWVQEVTVCGPTRGGKTLTFVVQWITRAIHEGRELLLMSSTTEKAAETWKEIDGSLRASDSLRGLLMPERYAGSLERRAFANGAVLRTVGANSLQSLGGFSAEIACCSEVDKYPRQLGDEAGATAQAKARTSGYPWTRKIVRESTPATSDSLLWPDLQSSHMYRPWVACPKCGAEQILHYDTDDGIEPADPKRPLAMTGKGGLRWEGETREAVAAAAYYLCPHCAGRWTEAERSQACRMGRWLGPGGVDPATEATRPLVERPTHIGLWWSALYLPWTSLGVEARACWAAQQGRTADETVQSVTQHRCALPYWSEDIEVGGVSETLVASRVNGLPRLTVPPGSRITGFVDINADRLHWVVCAWLPGAVGHVIDYGAEAVDRPRESLRHDQITDVARQAADAAIHAGLERVAALGHTVNLWLVDSGWDVSQPAVYRFCRAHHRFVPAKGFGADAKRWRVSERTGPGKAHPAGGNHWMISQTASGRVFTANADYWKAAAHQGFEVQPGQPGSISLWGDRPEEHRAFALQVTAEQFVREWVPEKGFESGWRQTRKDNHWLDCLAGARAAAESLGVRVLTAPASVTPRPVRQAPPRLPGRRPVADGFTGG
jgi:phage terminase large subunit GpA-like protein